MNSPNCALPLLLLLTVGALNAQVFDDFMPVPLSGPLADSAIDGQPSKEPRCLEPQDLGEGSDQVPRFYFDATNSTCIPFMYSGEGGNANNFLTELDCLNNCYTEVGEGSPLKEEDVHMINQKADLSSKDGCIMEGDGGGKNCSDSAEAMEHFFVQ